VRLGRFALAPAPRCERIVEGGRRDRRVPPPLVAVLVLALVAGTASRTPCASLPLTLSASPSASSYAVGDQIELTLTLTNVSGAPVTASTFPHGSLRLVGLTRDGVRIRPSRGVIHFEENPNLLRVEALTSIMPAGSAGIPFDVDLDDAVGSSITIVKLGSATRPHKTIVYRLTGPGLYRFRLKYRYAGPDGGNPNVFHRTLTSNEVSFTVN
jgi:hypothetical protein